MQRGARSARATVLSVEQFESGTPAPVRPTWQRSSRHNGRSTDSHPDYVDADWPYIQDFGIVILDQPVYLDEYGVLPEVGLLNELTPATGQTDLRFTDVGYGQTGVTVGGGPPQANFPLERRQAVQRYAPAAKAA